MFLRYYAKLNSHKLDCLIREQGMHMLIKAWWSCFRLQELEDLLPSRSEAPVISGDAEEVDLQEFDVNQSSSGSHRREAYNDSSDEESGHHGPGVQCAHQ